MTGRLPTAVAAVLLLVVFTAACDGGTRKQQQPAPPHSPKPGKVTISSTPGSAAVISEGKRLGKTPLTLERPAFEQLQLQVIKDGFRPRHLSVIVEPGETKKVHARLRLLQGLLLLRTGILRGARLYVDGEDRGRVPCKVEVAAGRLLKIRVEQQGFKVHKEELTVKAGETREVDVYLVREGQKAVPTGWISIETNRPASAFVDKLLLGQTPIKRRRLPARRYKLTLRTTNAPPRTLEVRIKADAEKRVKVDF
jgi:hypothetical protein